MDGDRRRVRPAGGLRLRGRGPSGRGRARALPGGPGAATVSSRGSGSMRRASRRSSLPSSAWSIWSSSPEPTWFEARRRWVSESDPSGSPTPPPARGSLRYPVLASLDDKGVVRHPVDQGGGHVATGQPWRSAASPPLPPSTPDQPGHRCRGSARHRTPGHHQRVPRRHPDPWATGLASDQPGSPPFRGNPARPQRS